MNTNNAKSEKRKNLVKAIACLLLVGISTEQIINTFNANRPMIGTMWIVTGIASLIYGARAADRAFPNRRNKQR